LCASEQGLLVPQTSAGKLKLVHFFKDEKAATLTTVGRTKILEYLEKDGITGSSLNPQEIFIEEEGEKRAAETPKSDWVMASLLKGAKGRIDVFASRVDALTTKGAVVAWERKPKGTRVPDGEKNTYNTLRDKFAELGYKADVRAGKALKAAGGWRGRNVIVLRKN
jgi:hypothetical protein